MKKTYILLFCFFLIASFTGRSQDAPITTAGQVSATGPGLIAIPVTVKNFNNIGAISLTLDYDYSVIHFLDAVQNPLLSAFIISDNNTGNGNHRLIMSWFGFGGSLPDESILLTLNFNYINGVTSLSWFDNGISCEYANNTGDVLHDTPETDYYIDGLVYMDAVLFSVGGGGTFCDGHGSADITLSGSETGVSYELWNNGLATGITLSGTGDALVFPNITQSGTYTIKATNLESGWVTGMIGIAVVMVTPASSIAGTLSYFKPGGTNVPIGGAELQLTDGFTQVATATTAQGTGHYAFNNICSGNYSINVLQNSLMIGGINATDAAQINQWGLHPIDIKQVKFQDGDVQDDYFMSATDAYMVQAYFVYGTPFARTTATGTSWTYWKSSGNMIHSNYSPYNGPGQWPVEMSVTLESSDVTTDILAMCIGDFNSSFNPVGVKEAGSSMELQVGAIRRITPSSQFSLSILMKNAGTIGAISLILDFPADLAEVQNVVIPGTDEQPDWAVSGNELRIGWHSANPLIISDDGTLLQLVLKTTGNFVPGKVIRFTLAADPLNEIADNKTRVIPGCVLYTEAIEYSATGVNDCQTCIDLLLSNHPNPFNGQTTISYNLPFNGEVTMEIRNPAGMLVNTIVNEQEKQGEYSLKLEAGDLQPGIYTLTMKLRGSDDLRIRTIKIVKML